jgi:hypothetical protein
MTDKRREEKTDGYGREKIRRIAIGVQPSRVAFVNRPDWKGPHSEHTYAQISLRP